jgi:hypothetical protein
MEEKVFKHLVAEFQKEIEGNANALHGGAAKSFEEYKYLCGVIRGLSLAQSYVNDLMRKMEHFND